jgi:cytochrome oxidase Cu insertion factor (SCO1/SenC/PrrC family)
MRKRLFCAMTLAAATFAARLAAQQPTPAPAPAPPAATPLPVGAEAPDFTLPASTRDGVSAQPVHLKDLRGKTVVMAFFYQARTKG